MNKKYLKNSWVLSIVLCALAAGSFTSCESFLEEKEQPRMTVDFYKTQQGIDAAGVAAYGYLRYGVSAEVTNLLTELGTDIMTGASGGTSKPTDSYNSSLNPVWSNLYSWWSNCYKGINTTNVAIEGIEGSQLTQDQKNATLAEMRFLRAYFYFDMVQHFGGLPIVTKPDYKEIRTSFPRSSVADVYKLIISDLRFAEQYMRETPNERGRATRYSAAHLLARVYLTRGSAVTDQRGQKPTDVDSTLYYAEKVINSGKYKLVDNFAALWDEDNQNNSEGIFCVQFTQEAAYNEPGNLQHLYWNTGYESRPGMIRDFVNGRPYNFHLPTNKTMFELFDRKNDSRFYKSFRWVNYANYEKTLAAGMNLGDTAIYISLNPLGDGRGMPTRYKVYYSQWNKADPWKTDLNPAILKYMNKYREKSGDINHPKGSREWVRMRLGETYLLAAEAAGRKGDYTTAAKYINVLRQRAAWHAGETKYMQYWREEGGAYGDTSDTYPLIKVSEADLQTDFVAFILDERGRELLGELTRWEDLARCEKVVEYVKKWSNPTAVGNIKDYHKLRPIPQNHIDRLFPQPTDLKAEQNPGYN